MYKFSTSTSTYILSNKNFFEFQTKWSYEFCCLISNSGFKVCNANVNLIKSIYSTYKNVDRSAHQISRLLKNNAMLSLWELTDFLNQTRNRCWVCFLSSFALSFKKHNVSFVWNWNNFSFFQSYSFVLFTQLRDFVPAQRHQIWLCKLHFCKSILKNATFNPNFKGLALSFGPLKMSFIN